MSNNDWTTSQNDETVAEYFRILADQVAGRKVVKTERQGQLGKRIGRTEKAVSAKFRNVSAILDELGEAWVSGYMPWQNYQGALVDAVIRWLSDNEVPEPSSYLQPEPANLKFGNPPNRMNSPPPRVPESLKKFTAKYDIAARNERNCKLGQAGESYVLAYERQCLLKSRYASLANEVTWISRDIGDGEGYDIRSYSPKTGQVRLIEVKTTNGSERTPFYITENELVVSRDNQDSWILYRLYNFKRKPEAFKLKHPLDMYVNLYPSIYKARF